MSKLLNRNQLKLIAMLLMIIDHIGALLLNNAICFRAIGRLSFPLFVFLLVDGFKRSHNLCSYAKRLLLFWIISIIPYSLAFYGDFFNPNQNIFLSLYIYLALYCALDSPYIAYKTKTVLTIICAVLSNICKLSYGWYGVALAVIMYQYYQQEKNQTEAFYALLSVGTIYGIMNNSLLPVLAAFSMFLLSFNGRIPECKAPDKLTSYIFYLFYPIHLLFFALLT